MTSDIQPMKAPITVEKAYLVGGKRVTVHVVFPASAGEEIGLENVYICARRVIVRAESKDVTVKELKLGQ